MTKTKHPNKGHSPNNGQRPMYQSVRYSETPLYCLNFVVLRLCHHVDLHVHVVYHINLVMLNSLSEDTEC